MTVLPPALGPCVEGRKTTMTLPFHRFITGISVRARIIAAIPVVEFMANGIAYTSARIPATRASGEIGAMARTVIVFRDNMIEHDRLTADQIQSAREKERRSESVAGAIAAFWGSIEQALGNLRGTAHQLEYLRPSSTALPTR
jgi:hypothetical protein